MGDKDRWHFTRNRKYTIKSRYEVERVYPDKETTPVMLGPTVDIESVLMESLVPTKNKIFFMAIDVKVYIS